MPKKQTSLQDSSARLPIGVVAKREGVSVRTIDRWMRNETLDFPRPVYILGRKYWSMADIEKWENTRAGGQS